MVVAHFFVLNHLHIEESVVELLVVEVVNYKFFVAACGFGELYALLQLAMRLEKVKNRELIQVFMILFHKVKEQLLQNLDLLPLAFGLLPPIFFV